MKFKTVREGEQAVIFNHLGQGKLIVGPKRVFLFRERFHKLPSYTANRYEYVVIHMNNGSVVHKPGPCQLFANPLENSRCSSQRGQSVDANHLLVVYKRLKGDKTERRIIQGPALFVPEAEEWYHEFVWHGSDPANKTRVIPGLNKFTQLATIPSNFYYNVREVRTCDDTMLTVKVMLFYSLVDVLKMLDTTHDPMADLINALCADVVSFVGQLTYESFIEKTSLLSEQTTYPQLRERAMRIGFKVDKIVFRGYHASDQLQEMQNVAIETRTKMLLQRELEDQEQKRANFTLNKTHERSSLEQTMEIRQQAHKQKVAELKQKHLMMMETMKLKQKLELSSAEEQITLGIKEAEYQHQLDQLHGLTNAGVDLTAYLNLGYSQPAHDQINVTLSV